MRLSLMGGGLAALFLFRPGARWLVLVTQLVDVELSHLVSFRAAKADYHCRRVDIYNVVFRQPSRIEAEFEPEPAADVYTFAVVDDRLRTGRSIDAPAKSSEVRRRRSVVLRIAQIDSVRVFRVHQ